MMGGHETAPAPQPQQNPEAVNNQGYAPQQQVQQQYAQPVQPQQGYAQPAPQQYAPAPVQQSQGYTQSAPYYSNNTGATKSGGMGWLGYLFLGGLGYLAYRLFFAKKKPAAPISRPNYQRTSHEPAYAAATNGGSSADFNTDIMFKKGDSTVSLSKVNLAKSRDTVMPAGFDSVAFLDDVKRRYMDLQQAWDTRDSAEIRGLTTDKVFAEIQAQLKDSSDTNATDVLKLDADILEVRELNSEFEAVVLFDAIMREDDAGQANQVREVWHFVKSKSGLNANWMLDGIQQLED
jgi:predicted lipid-binding transport protein (Tim44 family)